MATVSLKIDGMHCQACVARVRRALEKVDGIAIHDVTVGSASVDAGDPAAAIAAINNAGYPTTRA